MKNSIIIKLNLVILIYSLCYVQAQENMNFIFIGNSQVDTVGKIQEYKVKNNNSYNTDQWRQLKEEVAVLKNHYLKTGIVDKSKSTPKFILPVELKEGLTDEGFYSITAYVDHDTLYPNFLLDYECGDLTYDLDNGYNHTGTDYFPWPFPWHKMYNDEVEIVAAAPGILVVKQDGNFDQHCEENTEPWNGVCILHDDGSRAWYVHAKKNSLTEKFVGEEIAQGEYLGIVGSSGSSLSPHLHFEVYDSDNNLIDPFTGPCNNEIEDSWWIDQLPYKDAGVNKISTNFNLPVFPECPEEEILNESDEFYPGDSIYLMSYFRNISYNDTVEVTIYRPDNSVFSTSVWYSPDDFYTASWLSFFIMLQDVEFGDWKYSLKYKDITYEHLFQLKDPQGINLEINRPKIKLFPNPSHDQINLFINLDWGEISSLSLINILGEEIQKHEFDSQTGNSFHIDISGIENGIYFIKVESAERSKILRFIKN